MIAPPAATFGIRGRGRLGPSRPGQGTGLVAPAQLVQVQSLVLGLPIGTDGQRVAQNQLVVSIDRALEARRARLALSNSAIDPFRLTALFLVAATTLAALGCVQADRLRRAATAMALPPPWPRLGAARLRGGTVCGLLRDHAGLVAPDPPRPVNP